ncbi:hypothetical protein [Volucribacter amazonae]|uniref:Uncharacterized protein n=1 Tax=Volucribacter amazonae TaxID=256731 RepID=A0A9X4PHL8_9PAST|nr:hypothetical protein [Volucribacter amazonae]MDG6895360.1 hypothetical protein [Volucribacter amazonae]
MSTTIKLLNAKSEIASYKVSKGESLILEGQSKVNYQLIDDATGKGPEKIIAKRDGNDLQIMLDKDSKLPEIVIKNYYEGDNPEESNSNSMVIGEANNGLIYSYVPESNKDQDAVAMLDNQESAIQILGGEELKAGVFWDYSPWWLLGLGLLGAGIAFVAGGKGDNNSGATPPLTG